MTKSMSLNARRELLASVQKKYLAADWVNKGKILDGFVSATDYERKYAIQLLNNRPHHIVQPSPSLPPNRKYSNKNSGLEFLIFSYGTTNFPFVIHMVVRCVAPASAERPNAS